jgi:tetratricopeptide (TPR) repeat protein
VESDWFYRKGEFTDAVRVAASGVDKAARRKSPQLQATLKMTQGRASRELGELDDARRIFADAQALYESLADWGGAAEAMRGEAMVLQAQGELAGAEQRLDAALAIGLKMRHERLLTDVRLTRSEVTLQLGKLSVAKTDAEAALASARTMGHRSAIARALNALGGVAAAQGDAKTARAHFEEALRLGREIGEPSIVQVAERSLTAHR